MKHMTALLMALALALPAMTFAQDEPRVPRRGDGPPQDRNGGPGGPGQRMPPPIMAALDSNHDGVLDEDEIKNATAALRKLDKNGDGKLTMDELRPPRGEGERFAAPNEERPGRRRQAPQE